MDPTTPRQPMTDDERGKHIEALTQQLAEFGDAVQVHVSWMDDDGFTHCKHFGTGNWYARQAMANEFVTTDYSAKPDDDEEGEAWRKNAS